MARNIQTSNIKQISARKLGVLLGVFHSLEDAIEASVGEELRETKSYCDERLSDQICQLYNIDVELLSRTHVSSTGLCG
jgi:hypothetical protein